MLAGGTGITPMLQISDEIYREGSVDKTKVSLLFANQSEEYVMSHFEFLILTSGF